MEGKISYIKKVYARRSIVAIALAIISLTMLSAIVGMAVSTNGQVALYTAAMGLSSMLLSFTGVIYGILSFFEKDKNYTFARLSLFVNLLILAVMSYCIFIGI